MKTSTYLKKARDIIANGWYQGDYSNGEGCYCIYGALYSACGQNVQSLDWEPEDTKLLTAGQQALIQYLPDGGLRRSGGVGLVSFNDKRDTTQQDVLDLFDKAIAHVEAGESAEE